MDIRDSAPTGEVDFTAAMPLEISEETASRTDDLLREFAEEAGLDTALVVDRSGALVAGISAEADVTIEVISALVAGASGAMRALVAQLGETGAMESLHLGGNRLIYLKETVHRFILVAVAEAGRPAGLVRQQALAIEGRLAELLREVRPADPPLPADPTPPAVRSLRETVRERAARRQTPSAPPVVPVVPPTVGHGPVFELDAGDEEDGEEEEALDLEAGEIPEVVSEVEEPVVLPCDEEPGIEETFETLDLQPELQEPGQAPGTETEGEDIMDLSGEDPETTLSPVDEETLSGSPGELPPVPVAAEPREILEPIDFGEPEIVIEPADPPVAENSRPPVPRLPVDSPFEAEEDEEEDEETIEDEGLDSVFEFDGEADEEDEELTIVTSPEDAANRVIESEPEPGLEPERLPPPLPPSFPESLFEEDEGDDEDEDDDRETGPEEFFELDREDEREDEWDEESEDGDPETETVGREPEGKPLDFINGEEETILFEMPLESISKPVAKPDAKRSEKPTGPEPLDDGDAARERVEMIDEEEEESEIRSSGPFYF
jgi:predicted regulator of Ras-like GTPase activity (Roadblock/LC7/MglB family)